MNCLVTGGLGFIGRHLTDHLLSKGHDVIATGRRSNPQPPHHPRFRYLAADTTRGGDWQRAVQDRQVIVNLAGRTIFTRWNARAKREIRESRIETTRRLVEGLPAGAVLCSASAVGYYGDRGEELLTEESAGGDDFLARLALEWEHEALAARGKGARVVLMRFGIVLDRDGGAIPLMRKAFGAFMGGPLGSGRQWFPWIHMQDLLAAMEFAITDRGIEGPVNFCAPEPVRNQTLTRVLAHKLNRPAFMPAPARMIRLMLGEFGQTLLNSQRAVPARLQQHGFAFTYPHIDAALEAVL